MRRKRILSAGIAVCAMSVGLTTTSVPAAHAATGSSINVPIVLILMENEGKSSILNNANAPYINGKGAFTCGGANPGLTCGTLFDGFANPQPQTYPSLPAYVELTSADLRNFTTANCGDLTSGGNVDKCFKNSKSTVVPTFNPQQNIFHQLQLSTLPNAAAWGAYAEGMASNCKLKNNAVTSTGGSYATRHFPVVYYGDVTNQCATKAVPYVKGGSAPAPDPNNLPQFSFITPDTCSDMHDGKGCVVPTTPTNCTGKTQPDLKICIGDDWLANNVPQFLSKALVMVTWDEDAKESSNEIVLTMDGIGVTTKSTNPTSYTFDGLLRSFESYWNLSCIGGDGVSQYGHRPGTCGATPVPIPTASITDFSPTSGPVGTNVVITGTNLDGTRSVKFNGTSATPMTVSATQVTAKVPPGATTGPIRVVTSASNSRTTANFNVT
jgi:hypothetical protein